MKTLFTYWPLAALLALGGAPCAYAQRGGVQLGMKAGLNLATYTGADAASLRSDWRAGLATGLVATYQFAPRLGVQAEALYSQKGVCQADFGGPLYPNRSATYLATLGYLDVPILLAVGRGSGGEAGFFAATGPQLSLALHKREFVRLHDDPLGGGHEETLDTNAGSLRPVAAGYVAGVGYQWASGLGAELRYSGDFTTVYRPGYGAGCLAPGGSPQLRNGVVQLQLRYLFGKRRPAANAEPATTYHRPLPLPDPDPEVVLHDPGLRRLVRVLAVLSWLSFQWGPGPGCHPGPMSPRSQPLPLPRPTLPTRRLPGPVRW